MVVGYHWSSDDPPLEQIGEGRSWLPRGNGRSYGDVCLNDGGFLIDCLGIKRFIQFNTDTGALCCEAGVLIADILDLVVPHGWFLPVTPGTRFVTVGGAIANDVHGKNHHRAGTFGCHIIRFELLRSDGTRLECSPEINKDWFSATISGLGLTGIITWAELQLKSIAGPVIDQQIIRYDNLDEFMELSRKSDNEYEYTVAWVDCLAKGASRGRGLFIRGNHTSSVGVNQPSAPTRHMHIPFDPPFPLVNTLTLHLFNTLYYHRQRKSSSTSKLHYAPFFYPLDAIIDWNRIYGKRGFMQYQCVLHDDTAPDALKEILAKISHSGTGSFLAVLKVFGDIRSPGLMSFPRSGLTLALDFPNRGESTLDLLDQLDEITVAAHGAVYPAKDARMSAENFRLYYPSWEQLESYRDKQISSGFWRRVTGISI